MNLQFHLLSRIALVAFLCLLVTTAYVLHHSDRQARQATQSTAESLSKQLEFQLLRNNAGFNQANRFPDFDLWKQTGSAPGICVRFTATDSAAERSLCNGVKLANLNYPAGFGVFYQKVLNPGIEQTRAIAFNGRVYGILTVTASAEMEIAQAWENIHSLLGLSAMTVMAVCLLVYLSISRALRPARIIVAGLESMEKELAYRLPPFELNEWQRIAKAINQLASSQQQLLGERQKELISRIKQRDAKAKILVFSMHQNPSFAVQASRAGALGYVTKSSPPEVLLRAIFDVYAGRHILSADIAQALALEKLGSERIALEALTVREFEILRLLVEARPIEEIAQTLNISPKTVGNCHYLIKRKLGVTGDIELTRLAIKLNVISLLELSSSVEPLE
jgi:DNA-binding NarL/FixJ family response regulator